MLYLFIIKAKYLLFPRSPDKYKCDYYEMGSHIYDTRCL